nr:hypothetical protein [uncultured Mediterranean phage uvMED]
MSHTPPRSVVLSFGRKAQTIELPAFTTSATSKSAMQSDQLDVTKSAVRGLLIEAEQQYNRAFDMDDHTLSLYWDGYMRAIYHVLEMEGQ